MEERQYGHRTGEREQKRMVVVRTDERRGADQAIGARSIFHGHRLLPAFGKPVGVYPGRDIGGAARSDRHDQADRPLRPRLGMEWRRRRGEPQAITSRQSLRARMAPSSFDDL